MESTEAMNQVMVPAWVPGALLSCTPTQMNAIVQVLMDAHPPPQQTSNTIADADSASKVADTAKFGTNETSASIGIVKTTAPMEVSRKFRRNKAKRDAACIGPKRPLNSWMAFRSKIISNRHTSSLSNPVHRVLQRNTHASDSKSHLEDPNDLVERRSLRGKMVKLLILCKLATQLTRSRVILAKAYSILRANRSKDEVPLDIFLRLCAPKLHVIAPGEYALVMGWSIKALQSGDFVRHYFPQQHRLRESSLSNNSLRTLRLK